MAQPQINVRLPTLQDRGPTYAIWEVTLRCNQACRFCGTRAGRAGPDELDTAQCLEVVRQLAAFGVREVTMHGGEAYLRPDLFEIVRAIRGKGMVATMVTGGRGLSADIARQMKEADISAVSVSVDGPRDIHNRLRGFDSSFQNALAALTNLQEAGIKIGCNTQVNQENLFELHALYDELRKFPLYGWQVQLMVPMGRAADEPKLWLHPHDMLDLFPILAELRHRADQDQIPLWPGDNIGYFGPFEDTLRGDRVPGGCSGGCGAGIVSIGIEANGDIKGCSALCSDGFVAGNIRTRTIEDMWENAAELKLSRCFSTDKLWGYCKNCYYGDICKAGCVWTANTLLGRYGNNPYCHHRALEMLAQGKRERLVRVREAPGKNRDCALFVIEEEPAEAEWAARMFAKNQIPVTAPDAETLNPVSP